MVITVIICGLNPYIIITLVIAGYLNLEDIYKCLNTLRINYDSHCLTNNKILVSGSQSRTTNLDLALEEESIILFSKKKESKTKESFSNEIKVLDNETNKTEIYPSIRKAASVIKVDVKSLNRHCILTGDLGLRTLYKNRYFIELIKSKKLHTLTQKLSEFEIELKDLKKDKVYFFEQDKKTLSHVFNSCWEAARVLTPERCAHLTDNELKLNKNLQHIRRVINKGVLTTTEKGKFYVFQNLGYSDSLDLVVFGYNLSSTVGVKQISKQERNMVKLPNFELSVMIGLLLSDGGFAISKRSENYYFQFKQSFDKSKYLWFVFSLLSHYCGSLPYSSIGERNAKKTYALAFYTRAYPFITELHNKFFYGCLAVKGLKAIPLDIYELLSPPALAHLIMGDGSRKDYGLEICTDCYSISDVVRLCNVLVIRYQLNCTIRLKRENQYRIYITSKSMSKLRTIVYPYMHPSMMYKL